MPPQHPVEPPGDRLAALRGPRPPQPYTTRKITALTANPACSRRAVLDAAGVDKALLAQRMGYEPRFGQSPFAIAREQAFEALVKWGGYAELIRLLREQLDVPVEEAGVSDLNEVGGDTSLVRRARETRNLLARLASGGDERLILDRPVLTLEVAGQTAYLEPQAVTHRVGGKFYVVEIRSFPAIDGQANPTAVAQTAKQAAVSVLALHRTFAQLDLDQGQIAHEFLLVCPKDFSNRPYGRLVDVRQELDALRFQLTRLRRADDLARELPSSATFDTDRDAGQLDASVRALDASYTPDCLSFCELARYCRDEATACASPARLGGTVRDALPGIDSTRTALAYLDGVHVPGPTEAAAIDRLRTADRLRRLRRGEVA
ncbi:hypothetical protein P354_21740 [Streptomyces sp. F-3]|uniref:hypothetical protein n=1 Tax=unclassified Streptomyces TaxID=2593676 RepID=UPI0007C3BD14|nr:MULTISPECIES: hypothetical protein [unclassified Streptomyces]MDN5384461.1 hypothetical protein [Streptomyces sp. LB8]GAT83604.1 hypothetical protein P354_21740 [Streptomyces sp. F-3]